MIQCNRSILKGPDNELEYGQTLIRSNDHDKHERSCNQLNSVFPLTSTPLGITAENVMSMLHCYHAHVQDRVNFTSLMALPVSAKLSK